MFPGRAISFRLPLIWNDLSTTGNGFSFVSPEEVVQVAVEEALRRLITQIFAGRCRIIVIRRELPRTICAGWSKDFRITRPRILLPVGPKTATCTTSITISLAPILGLCCLTQCFSLLGFHFHPNGPDEPQEFASYRRDHFPCVFTACGELSVARV
jgi:hypothetical protein